MLEETTFIESFISSNEVSDDSNDTGDEIAPFDPAEVFPESATR